jgi:hypothetical protein
MDTKMKKRSSGPKREEGLPFKEIPTRNTSAGAGSSGATLRGLVAASELAVEISAKGRDELVMRNLSEVKPRTPLLGVSSTDIPLKGASSSSTPTARYGIPSLWSRWTPSGKEGFIWFRYTIIEKGKNKGKQSRNSGAFSNQGM